MEEIEYAIGALPYVLENIVLFVKHKEDSGSIVACVNARQRDEISLIEDLREKLPAYMIPNKVLFTDDLPKNKNGKIDRQAIQNWGLN